MSGMIPSSGSVLGPHRATNIPYQIATQTMIQQPRAQGRVFAMSQHDARTSNAVVEGMNYFIWARCTCTTRSRCNSFVYF